MPFWNVSSQSQILTVPLRSAGLALAAWLALGLEPALASAVAEGAALLLLPPHAASETVSKESEASIVAHFLNPIVFIVEYPSCISCGKRLPCYVNSEG